MLNPQMTPQEGYVLGFGHIVSLYKAPIDRRSIVVGIPASKLKKLPHERNIVCYEDIMTPIVIHMNDLPSCQRFLACRRCCGEMTAGFKLMISSSGSACQRLRLESESLNSSHWHADPI